MKTDKFTFLLLLLCITPVSGLWAQEIRGTVIDEQDQVIPYVGVAVRTESDSTLITGTYSDEEGHFVLSLEGKDSYISGGALASSAPPSATSPASFASPYPQSL